MSTISSDIDQLSINTIRTLSMDGVQKANSGHPGTPMALAPVTYGLWNNVLRYDPQQPLWPARDRFVLSCGHASMLLYSVLHLAGVRKLNDQQQPLDAPSISLDDLKNFRQLGSPCAGHPEHGDAAGIETTTGPLGQGVANSVGLAMAAKWLSARYDRPAFDLFDYNTYALCSDGDLMEGISSEAASLAAHLKLSNLCWIYDDNRITIEGRTDLAFTEDVGRRFEGHGWNVLHVDDANDLDAIASAFEAFKNTTDRPTLIVLRSIIGFGSPNKADSSGAHGSPLGPEEVALTKKAYGWPAEDFLVPEEVVQHFAAGVGARGQKLYAAWQANFEKYAAEHPELAAQVNTLLQGELPAGWDAHLPEFAADAKGLATRVSSGKVLNGLAQGLPWLVGGSADLAPSTMTMLNDVAADNPAANDPAADGAKMGHCSAENHGGRNLHFGIREHAMAAICNGLALSGLRSFGATFFVFTDYMRPSMRLSAIMHLPVMYVLTHDSIGLGEDGPTHQPVEQLAACRAIPGLIVLRPGDANEVKEAYRTVVSQGHRPAAMVLTRQALPTLDRKEYGPATGLARGAYILSEAAGGEPEAILIGTGSETTICLAAQKLLAADGVRARVVSMPSWELFEEQDQTYREEILPPQISARVAVEAGIAQGWDRYLGPQGRFVGMSSFGASAPIAVLYKHFGITPENVAQQAKEALGKG